jgi:hypothetical protein
MPATRNQEELNHALNQLKQAQIALNSVAKADLTPDEKSQLWDVIRLSGDVKDRAQQYIYL